MIRVNRAELLQKLELVQPGTTPVDVIEQSSCFIFKDGKVLSYNDETACSIPCDLKLEGAVQAKPLLDLLQELPEDEVEIEAKETKFIVTGKRRKASIRMEAEITLAIATVEPPKGWKPLHEEFADAINIVKGCTGKSQGEFSTITCVHITPNWVEACDTIKFSRYRLKTGVTENMLVQHSSIKNIVAMGMTKFSETESWLHFKNAMGLVISCRRYVEDFPDCNDLCKITGEPTSLPKGLASATKRAQIFTDDGDVLVELRPGKARIKGMGAMGQYSELKDIKFSGKPFAFLISPELFIELTERHNECELSENHLKINGGRWCYVTCLGQVEEGDE